MFRGAGGKIGGKRRCAPGDRIIGDERNYAGTSFVTPDMFGSYRYGSVLLNISFDPGVTPEMASYAFDDDGTPERASDGDDWSEGFLAVLDGDGVVEQVFTVVGGDGDAVSAVGATADGRKLYATGFTRLGADFDGDGEIESASMCHQLGDLYLAVYRLADSTEAGRQEGTPAKP